MVCCSCCVVWLCCAVRSSVVAEVAGWSMSSYSSDGRPVGSVSSSASALALQGAGGLVSSADGDDGNSVSLGC